MGSGRYLALITLLMTALARTVGAVDGIVNGTSVLDRSIPLRFSLMSQITNIIENNETTPATEDVDVGDTIFRAYAEVAGRLLQVDTGSAAVAFCEEPQGVQNKARHSIGELGLSGYQTYGTTADGPFWFGKSYIGGLPWGNGTGATFEAKFSVTEETEISNGFLRDKTLGVDDICSTPSAASVGIDRNGDGILGISHSGDSYMPTKDIVYYEGNNTVTFNPADENIQNILENTESSFMRWLKTSLPPDQQMFALAWNGSLGPETGKLLIGKDAIVEKSKHQSASPEAILRFDEYGWYQFIVTGLYLVERDGKDPIWINQTETTNSSFGDPSGVRYVFDTGNPRMSLPREVENQVSSILSEKNITTFTLAFTIADLLGGDSEVIVKFDINSTLFETFEFVDTLEGVPPMWGLPSMSFLEEVHFFVGGLAEDNCTTGCTVVEGGKDAPNYIQFVARERQEGDKILHNLIHDPGALTNNK